MQQIGRSTNPDHPYDDPRVHVHIDDGRAFLRRTRPDYDLIIFALPDSLTLVAGSEPGPAGELPVHRRRPCSRSATTSRPAAPSRCTTSTASTGWSAGSPRTVASGLRARPVRRPAQPAVQAVIIAGPDASRPALRRPATGAPAGPVAASAGRPPSPTTTRSSTCGPGIPAVYLVDAARNPARSACSRSGSSAARLRRMRPYADLFLLGRGVPAARDASVTGSRCCSGRRGWSTRSCSPASCSRSWSRSRSPAVAYATARR